MALSSTTIHLWTDPVVAGSPFFYRVMNAPTGTAGTITLVDNSGSSPTTYSDSFTTDGNGEARGAIAISDDATLYGATMRIDVAVGSETQTTTTPYVQTPANAATLTVDGSTNEGAHRKRLRGITAPWNVGNQIPPAFQTFVTETQGVYDWCRFMVGYQDLNPFIPDGVGLTRIYTEDASGNPSYGWFRLNTWLDYLNQHFNEIVICLWGTPLDLAYDSYTAGTVSVTNGSTTVTGSGTNWTSAIEGWSLHLPIDGPNYQREIASVTSPTELELAIPYTQSTKAGEAYYAVQTNEWGWVNSRPKSYCKWKNLVTATLRQLVSRYGQATVDRWRFEIWNEPDLDTHFWPYYVNGDPSQGIDWAEFAQLYRAARSSLVTTLPNSKSGPCFKGPGQEPVDCAAALVAAGQSMELLSLHEYGRNTAEHIREFDMLQTTWDWGDPAFGTYFDPANLEIYISENGATFSTTDMDQLAGPYSAAYFWTRQAEYHALEQGDSDKTLDVVFQFEPTANHFRDGFGTQMGVDRDPVSRWWQGGYNAIDLVARPQAFAQRFLGQIGGTVLQSTFGGAYSLLTAYAVHDASRNKIAILICNWRDVSEVTQASDCTVTLTIASPPSTVQNIIVTRFGQAYDAWQTAWNRRGDLGRANAAPLTVEDVARLKTIATAWPVQVASSTQVFHVAANDALLIEPML